MELPSVSKEGGAIVQVKEVVDVEPKMPYLKTDYISPGEIPTAKLHLA